MFSRALFRTRSVVHSASLFTASVGIGACPKRRRQQSNVESGEDAYFVKETRENIYAGVFDGVGGWADSGVDPSIFSHGLARHSKGSAATDPAIILQEGYDKVQKDKSIEMGSSTACITAISLATAAVRVANLGDSGFLIADKLGNIVYESKPQIYFFNAPYQLAKMPDSMRQPGSLENRPNDADISSHDMSKGGYIILATDGYLDNVFKHETESVMKSVIHEGSASIAKALMAEGVKNGRSTTKNGPFAAEALRHRKRFHGGKEDDIVVIVISIHTQPTAKL